YHANVSGLGPPSQADPRAAIAGGASGVTMARAGPHPHPRRARSQVDAMGRRLRSPRLPASMSPASMAMGRRLRLRPGPAVSGLGPPSPAWALGIAGGASGSAPALDAIARCD